MMSVYRELFFAGFPSRTTHPIETAMNANNAQIQGHLPDELVREFFVRFGPVSHLDYNGDDGTGLVIYESGKSAEVAYLSVHLSVMPLGNPESEHDRTFQNLPIIYLEFARFLPLINPELVLSPELDGAEMNRQLMRTLPSMLDKPPSVILPSGTRAASPQSLLPHQQQAQCVPPLSSSLPQLLRADTRFSDFLDTCALKQKDPEVKEAIQRALEHILFGNEDGQASSPPATLGSAWKQYYVKYVVRKKLRSSRASNSSNSTSRNQPLSSLAESRESNPAVTTTTTTTVPDSLKIFDPFRKKPSALQEVRAELLKERARFARKLYEQDCLHQTMALISYKMKLKYDASVAALSHDLIRTIIRAGVQGAPAALRFLSQLRENSAQSLNKAFADVWKQTGGEQANVEAETQLEAHSIVQLADNAIRNCSFFSTSRTDKQQQASSPADLFDCIFSTFDSFAASGSPSSLWALCCPAAEFDQGLGAPQRIAPFLWKTFQPLIFFAGFIALVLVLVQWLV